MRNFYKVGDSLQIGQLMLALQRHEKASEIWKEDTYLRTFPQGPFGDCESVILRFPTRTQHETEEALKGHLENFDQHECYDTDAFKLLPEARNLVFGLMSYVQGERLGRVVINKLKPGGVIYPHSDGEEHAKYYDRFHIVLHSSPGVIFRAESEKVYMATGEAWWFNNAVEHEVINNSADDRIHLVMDIRTSK